MGSFRTPHCVFQLSLGGQPPFLGVEPSEPPPLTNPALHKTRSPHQRAPDNVQRIGFSLVSGVDRVIIIIIIDIFNVA